MKVKFDFQCWDEDAYVRAHSDLYCLGVDCISTLLAPLTRINEAYELIQFLEKQEFEWWGDMTRITGEEDQVRIYMPMSYNDEHAVINREILKRIVLDWIHFLETRESAEYEY